ncbi:hypothetical protein [Pseudomonas aeruginosa]|uniref:hypothetical protein n=1 Tax=Pseudomonas aeruginosa TaxID=287 RepID=UPI000BA947A8|nr:hypothetical protein [Pseudomonas aeruginosa]PAP72845.1 hypothetical protein CJ023_07750 [Pseudomonas aeruginosa]
MQIKLANPRGFCAGVDRAIEIVNRALDVFGPPIYVRHEVVHNKFVVDNLRQRGAIFVEELDQVPDNVIVIFSAHGVSQAVRKEAEGRGLKVFDAVGSPNSSNSNRLRELAERMGTPAYLIDGAEDMQRGWFDGVRRIGITAGASAPEVLVRGVIAQLREWGASEEQELEGREENITFSMPKELRVKAL